MQDRLFGTDGIRGVANQGVMSAEMALKLGMAAGTVFQRGDHRHRVVIGKDTRLSGYLFESALTSGFIAAGMDVILVGPMPTPAVAMLTKSLRADIGVVISASHNPYHDNGIKLFGPDGYKLFDQTELKIEQLIKDNCNYKLASPDQLGRAKRLDDAPGRYIEFIKNTFPKGRNLEGLKIVIDCANGAAYHLGQTILWELGADVIAIGINPDGYNINQECGSTYPENLINEVKKHGADLGIALDGDADRVVIVDEKGQLLDGDQIIASIATHMKKENQLNNEHIVATVMSNLGLEKYLNALGLQLARTKVGDRHVGEAMRKLNSNLGGEQSGHIILSDYTTTGDGLIAALQLLAVLVEEQKPASQLLRNFTPFPQKLQNIVCLKNFDLENEQLQKLIKNAEDKLQNGRILVRKSGTEALIRVMVEGEDENLVANVTDEITDFIQSIR